MFVFDGVNKRIYIENSAVVGGVVSFTPEDLWSRWMDWYLTGDNSKYPQALRITGGDPIGGGQYIGNYLFFRNDLGWRGVPPTIDGVTVAINGAFYGENQELPIMVNNPGQETDLIINRSSLVTNTTGGSGNTYTLTEIANAVWSHVNAGTKSEIQNVEALINEQEVKLDQILLDIETEAQSIKNTVIATS